MAIHSLMRPLVSALLALATPAMALAQADPHETPLIDSNAYLVNWMERSHADATIPLEQGKATAVILCNDIDLGGRTFRHASGECPKNIIIISDRIHITQNVNI